MKKMFMLAMACGVLFKPVFCMEERKKMDEKAPKGWTYSYKIKSTDRLSPKEHPSGTLNLRIEDVFERDGGTAKLSKDMKDLTITCAEILGGMGTILQELEGKIKTINFVGNSSGLEVPPFNCKGMSFDGLEYAAEKLRIDLTSAYNVNWKNLASAMKKYKKKYEEYPVVVYFTEFFGLFKFGQEKVFKPKD